MPNVLVRRVNRVWRCQDSNSNLGRLHSTPPAHAILQIMWSVAVTEKYVFLVCFRFCACCSYPIKTSVTKTVLIMLYFIYKDRMCEIHKYYVNNFRLSWLFSATVDSTFRWYHCADVGCIVKILKNSYHLHIQGKLYATQDIYKI
jgi:hypothetical protein